MTTLETIRTDLTTTRDKIAALPNEGSVLFNSETGLAIAIPEGDADRGHIAGLLWAHVFSDADRFARPPVPGLDRQFSDGAGRRFTLYAMITAKRISLEKLDAALAALPMIEA